MPLLKNRPGAHPAKKKQVPILPTKETPGTGSGKQKGALLPTSPRRRENLDSAGKPIADIAEKYGGYVNEMGTYQVPSRVESGQLDAAIADLATLGKLARKRTL